MTVAELIEALESLPDHSLEVFYPYQGDGGGLSDIDYVDADPFWARYVGGNSYTGAYEPCKPDDPAAQQGIFVR